MKIGLLPGSFDPPTLGHRALIHRAQALCDKLIVAVGAQPTKHPLFTPQERVALLQKIAPSVPIVFFSGLVSDFAQECKASFLIRAVRSAADLEGEIQMATANRQLCGLETIILLAEERHISSTLVKEIAHFGGPLDAFVPKEIENEIRARCKRVF